MDATTITEKVNTLKSVANEATRGISFDPEKRGQQFLAECEQQINEYLTQIPEEIHKTFVDKYIDLYRQWLRAMSRCISPMITGPAKFPTRRALKFGNYERAAYDRLRQWTDKFIKRCNRQQRLKGWDEIERLQEKVDTLKHLQEIMKAANKICRAKNLTNEEKMDELIAIGVSVDNADTLLHPSQSWMGIGFAKYQLSNNLARIKETELRIKRLTVIAESEDKELQIGDVKVKICNSDERIRLCYDGKPDYETIQRLKQNGFKWSPSNAAWQRQITDNAYWAAATVLAGDNADLDKRKEIYQTLKG